MFAQPYADADGFPHALAVEFLREVVVVENRLGVRVGGLQLQLARAHFEVERDYHAYACRLHAAAAPIDALGGKAVHVNDHVVSQVGAGGGVSQAELHPRPVQVELMLRLGAPGDVHQRMVAQVLPDAGDVAD